MTRFLRPFLRSNPRVAIHRTAPHEGQARIERPRSLQNHHVGAVFLDLMFGKSKFQGVKLLDGVKKEFNSNPIIVLSVQDDLSVATLLKREGAFANISKQSSAEERGCRDELSAFWQLRDAVVLALFSSIEREFRTLFDEMLKGANVASSGSERSAENLASYVDQALNAYTHECWGIYAGAWEDSGRLRGLSCRQIIRALGLVNDKWCEAWMSWHFNPDEPGSPWILDPDLSPFCRTYHQITTCLRNAASHAIVRDEHFTWNHVWVMMLTLFLKMEGLFRHFVPAKKRKAFANKMDFQLAACTVPAWSLLHLSGYVTHAPMLGENRGVIANRIAEEAEILRAWLSKTGDRLAGEVYLKKHCDSGDLLHELHFKRGKSIGRSIEQLRADLILLQIVNSSLGNVVKHDERREH